MAEKKEVQDFNKRMLRLKAFTEEKQITNKRTKCFIVLK